MVNARMAIGGRRSFEKDELGAAFSLIDALVEDVILHPRCQYFLIGLGQVKTVMFGKSFSHNLYSYLYNIILLLINVSTICKVSKNNWIAQIWVSICAFPSQRRDNYWPKAV